MRPSIALLLPALYCTALVAGELDGRYQANLDGQPTELVLRQDGQAVQGQYVENGSLQLDLAGSFDGQVLRAQISVPQSGQVVATSPPATPMRSSTPASPPATHATARCWNARRYSSAPGRRPHRLRQAAAWTRPWWATGCTRRSSTAAAAPASPPSTP